MDVLNSYQFQQERAELHEAIQAIKALMWAGNWQEAHQRLEDLLVKHERILHTAFLLKKSLTATYRKDVGRVENKFRAEDFTGLSLEYQVQMEMAERTALNGADAYLSYFLTPFVSTLKKIDEQIAEQLGRDPLWNKQGKLNRSGSIEQKPRVKQQSLYHLVLSSIGPCHWEVRGYSETTGLKGMTDESPAYLLQRLASDFEGEQITLEQGRTSDQATWPIWHRMFLANAFVELKVYNLARFVIVFILHSEESLQPLLDQIMTVITECGQMKTFSSGS